MIQPTPRDLQTTNEIIHFFEQLRKATFVDQTQSWTAAQRGVPVTLTDEANISIDMDLGNNFEVTLAGNRTLDNPSNAVAGQSGVITVIQDVTGSRTLAYGTQYLFEGGTAVVLTTGAGDAIDTLYYYVKSSTEILVSAGLNWS